MADTARDQAQQELLDRVADAITYHPGNRGGDPEQRHQVSLELARTALRALRPELEELAALRSAPRALAEAWSERDESVPPRERILRDLRDLTAVADPDHRARRGARAQLDLDAYRAEQWSEAAAIAQSHVRADHPDCAPCSMAGIIADELQRRGQTVTAEDDRPNTP